MLPTILAAGLLCTAASSCDAYSPYGIVEFDSESEFSHILVRKRGGVRTLLFVRDSGEEVVESMLDLRKPAELLVPYTRYMFLSYVFDPQPKQVLIVGLGGGSMVHFLRQHDPEVHVDAVEIDPTIVQVAQQYFAVRQGEQMNLITADGLEYLAETDRQYDVIFMDAFLKPSAETDSTGVPLELKTTRFYQQVQQKLTPDGVVVFNLNPHPRIRDDVEMLARAFPQIYLFRLPRSAGLVVVATRDQQRLPHETILRRAARLDRRFDTTFSFEQMARTLAR